VIDSLASSHVLWMFAPANRKTDTEVVPDLAAYPELRFLDRFHHVAPVVYAVAIFCLGSVLELIWPVLHTSGLQLLVFGFSISTVLLYQATFAVNSLGHKIGKRRFETKDESHNIWWLALLTLGEGWHNNHHRFPYAARAGLAIWEADMTWITLRVMARLRLVRDLRPVPASLRVSERPG
jgi:stearoyl-CoA desaturase (delta-9 desaturase)